MMKSLPAQSCSIPCPELAPMKRIQTQNTASIHLRGFTLVEIMVAITLSLFLIAGLVQIYSSSKRSSILQNKLAEYQETQRFVLDFLNRDIRMAGFFDQSKQTSIKPVTKFFINPDDAADSRNSKNGSGTDSDVLTVQYEAATDCLGNNISPDLAENVGPNGQTIAINNYFILNKTLYCKGNDGGSAGGARVALAAQPLIDGVVNMQVLYGEDLDNFVAGQQPTADRYVHVEDVTRLDRVQTVRIALLFETTGPVKDKAETVIYKLLDAPELSITDKFRREVVTTTIALRN